MTWQIVTVSDNKILISILILRRGALSRHPTCPYLACPNMHPKYRIWCIWAQGLRSAWPKISVFDDFPCLYFLHLQKDAYLRLWLQKRRHLLACWNQTHSLLRWGTRICTGKYENEILWENAKKGHKGKRFRYSDVGFLHKMFLRQM